MEHWQKITFGTIGGVVATFVFYFFMGKLMDYFYIKRKKKTQSEVHPRPERFYAKKQAHVRISSHTGFNELLNPSHFTQKAVYPIDRAETKVSKESRGCPYAGLFL